MAGEAVAATRSMTGFASAEGGGDGWRWSWELRSVNGRGLDLRLRLPDLLDGLETLARKSLQDSIARGNVTLSLKLARDEAVTTGALNAQALDETLVLLRLVEEAASAAGLRLEPARAAEILAMRGVVDVQAPPERGEALLSVLGAELAALVAEFNAVREREGAALEALLEAHVDEIDALGRAARAILADRDDHVEQTYRTALSRIVDSAEGIDPSRIAQELALLAIKLDVSEELDRLDAHVTAARELLKSPGPKGRKLDFLTQEFNREANTLCSKSQFSELTRIGLDLKHTIDRMREQVQNVE